MLCTQRCESAVMDDGDGGVRVWLAAGKHALQQCDGHTKEAARGDDAARRSSLSPLGPECEAPVQLSSIMIEVQEGKNGELSHGAPTLQTECEKSFTRNSQRKPPHTCFLIAVPQHRNVLRINGFLHRNRAQRCY